MKIEKRVEKLNKIRKEGFVPGVIYGKQIESTPIQASYKEVVDAYNQYANTKTFKVKLDGKTHQVYLKDLEKEALNQNNIIHFGLLKVTSNDTIKTELPVNVIGKEEIERQHLLVQIIMPKLEVEYPATMEVSTIDVDVTNLEVGEAIYVKDLKLPKGLELHHVEEDSIVVNIAYPKVHEEVEEKQEEPEIVEEEKEEE